MCDTMTAGKRAYGIGEWQVENTVTTLDRKKQLELKIPEYEKYDLADYENRVHLAEIRLNESRNYLQSLKDELKGMQ